MKKDVVMKKLAEATDDRGRVDLDILGEEAIRQIANAYVSGSRAMLSLYSKEEVAKYYGTTETVVTKCIEYAIVHRIMKYPTVVKVISNSGSNARRHASHKGLTRSENYYAKLVEERFKYFKETFETEENRATYDAAYKMYLGNSTLQKVMGAYGFSEQEMLYLLVRKACTDMSEVEYGIFSRKFFYDFLGTTMYRRYVEYIANFRKEMSKQISTMQKARAKKQKESEEYKTARAELVRYFEEH